MAETPDSVLAVDIYCCQIRRLVDRPPPHLARYSNFHLLNVKNNSGLEGLIKMVDLVRPSPPPLLPRSLLSSNGGLVCEKGMLGLIFPSLFL